MRVLFAAAVVAAPFVVSCSANAQPALDEIAAFAENSACAAYSWKERGKAPKAYIRGMALVFAKAVCEQDKPHVKIVSAPRGDPGTGADQTDGLTWYDGIFTSLKMPNDKSGLDTLRHAYVLMLGLGMRESSGKYCTGRDLSSDFNGAESAEAGLFQTSWAVSKKNTVLIDLNTQYSKNKDMCFLGVFKKDVQCQCCDAINWGDARHPEDKDGMRWQRLTKTCPVFAAEYAAVVLRVSGGEEGEYGPTRRREAEVRPECDSMFSEIQKRALTKPAICAALK